MSACASDADCTAAPLLHCDVAAPSPSCVECTADGDCTGGKICERDPQRAAFAKCVDCTVSRTGACTAQTSGSACLSAGSCGCNRDDDCGEARDGRVCADGACQSGCRADGSRGCPPGESCSGRGADVGVCVARPVPPPASADAGPTVPTPPLGAGGNCAVGFVPRWTRDGAGHATLGFVLLAALAVLWRRRRLAAATALVALSTAACSRTPTPLRPGLEGSVGLPHKGVLIGGVRMEETEHLRFLRDNERRWATARFARAIARAAERVANERPGSILTVGDLSAKGGGTLLPHLSHRSGRDADLLLYLTTLDGAPVASPGFVHVREDGLAWDEKNKRFLRFDVERQWLLLKTLLEDDEANVQFVFASKTLRALLAEYAVARGEPTELVYRAVTVLVQPNPGGEHDDHFHVRTACTDEEVTLGCEPSGPERPWIVRRAPPPAEDGAELARALFSPLEPEQDLAKAPEAAPASAAAAARGAP